MSLFDILKLIPQDLQQGIMDALVDFVSGKAKDFLGDQISEKIKGLKSNAAFTRAFRDSLQRAADRFTREYEIEDEDLVAAIAANENFFENEQVQKALLAIIRKPGVYLVEEREIVSQSFETVLPGRKNRQRVDRAVTVFLKCLAEELWTLPELQPIYSLQFQRMTAEATRQQVELQKAQLQALVGLGDGVRQALLQLTDAMARQKLLPSPDAPALPAPPKVYHNLPHPDYGTFVGREKELAQVHRILRPYPHSRHALVTIDGIGGIGKSALALEVAHHYRRNYDHLPADERFEAIIWTSAKSSVLTADGIVPRQQITRTLDDVYTTIAVTLEREDITRARPEEQDELVTRALTQQRTLLIVDNLETVDDERVNAFLRELPAPTKAIVTTRHRIDVAYPVRLKGMPREDGLTLIAQECEQKEIAPTKAQVNKLYDRIGGVPLAVVWSVAQIGYGYDVESVLRRLGQPTGDIALFCFKEAVERIRGTDAHVLLMALSLFATDANREALGYVAGLGKDVMSRDEGLVTLEKLSLVNKQGDRFRMLPLTKGYAQGEVIVYPDKRELERRWIDYFVELSKEYGDKYWNWTNYEWLLAEGNNILALADWAVSVDHAEIVLLLSDAIMRYLNITGRWVELVKYGEAAYRIAQSRNDRRALAWICTYWLGWLYSDQEAVVRADEMMRQGITFYREIGDEKGTCLATLSLGRTLRKCGKLEASKKKTQEALALAQKIEYDDGIAVAHFEMGKIARDLKMWAKAKAHYEKARAWCETDEANLDISLSMSILGNLGWIEFNLGNYEQGKELCERSLDFFKHMGGIGHLISLQCQLAAIEIALNNDEKARQYAQEALHWAERLRIPSEAKIAQGLLDQIADTKNNART